MRAVNWFGIAGGAVAIILIATSLQTPWWRLTIGEDFLEVNVSPFNFNFSFLNMTFVIPLILALNLTSLLMMLAGGVILIAYSLSPSKAYSKRLLCFAYKKPLYSVIFLLIGIVISTLILNAMFNVSIPIHGTSKVLLSSATQGAVYTTVTTSFEWPFWLAVVAAALCVVARAYHNKLSAS